MHNRPPAKQKFHKGVGRPRSHNPLIIMIHTHITISQQTEVKMRTLTNSLAQTLIALSALYVKSCAKGDAKDANNDRAFGALMLTHNLTCYLFHRVVDKIMQKADDRIAGTLENFHEISKKQIFTKYQFSRNIKNDL